MGTINSIDQSLNDIAEGRVYMAKNIDDLMEHLTKHTNDSKLIKRIKEAEKEISNGKTTEVKDINNIWVASSPGIMTINKNRILYPILFFLFLWGIMYLLVPRTLFPVPYSTLLYSSEGNLLGAALLRTVNGGFRQRTHCRINSLPV